MPGFERPTGPAARRGRPRDATRDRALLEATLAVLAESGYGGLTTAAVAARAGVSTATLYRRWPSKEVLVVAAAAAYALEGDLRALLRNKAASMTGKEGGVLRSLIAEAARNAPLAEALTSTFVAPVRVRMQEITQRAEHRGEIPPVEHADLLGDLVIGPMMSRFFLTPLTPDEMDTASATEMADRLLPFLLRAVGGTANG